MGRSFFFFLPPNDRTFARCSASLESVFGSATSLHHRWIYLSGDNWSTKPTTFFFVPLTLSEGILQGQRFTMYTKNDIWLLLRFSRVQDAPREIHDASEGNASKRESISARDARFNETLREIALERTKFSTKAFPSDCESTKIHFAWKRVFFEYFFRFEIDP